jgi:hypothetical protein
MIEGNYQPYLTATHIAPLQTIQALLPLLRSTSARDKARERDHHAAHGSKSIIFCVPATDARIGLPFAAARAMSAAATIRGAEVLRRELRATAAAGAPNTSEDTRVVIADIGAIDVPAVPAPRSPAVTERSVVLPNRLERLPTSQSKDRRRTSRKPTDVRKFAWTLIDVVNGGRTSHPGYMGWKLISGRLLNWLRGDRLVVGAGGEISYGGFFHYAHRTFGSWYLRTCVVPSYICAGYYTEHPTCPHRPQECHAPHPTSGIDTAAVSHSRSGSAGVSCIASANASEGSVWW